MHFILAYAIGIKHDITGGGGNFHYKGIYRRAAGRGILFWPSSI